MDMKRYILKYGYKFVHRVVYETFIGVIPDGYEIDHINAIRDDNRLKNLRCVTHKENTNNPLTIKHYSDANKGKTKSDFGEKYLKHFGYSKAENKNQYNWERRWYWRYGYCSWEKE